jgi:hypothetical protein
MSRGATLSLLEKAPCASEHWRVPRHPALDGMPCQLSSRPARASGQQLGGQVAADAVAALLLRDMLPIITAGARLAGLLRRPMCG